MATKTPVHYLRKNDSEWTPGQLIALDTETLPVDDTRDVQALRCWCVSSVTRPDGITDWPSRIDASGLTAESLAQSIDSMITGRKSAWLYAHNLGFDMAVSRLPLYLIRLGWEVTDFALDGRAPWMRMRNGKRHLTLSDSFSWLPKPLQSIAAEVNIVKPPLPADSDDIGAWLVRCKADVDILLTAMSELMDWWDTQHKGRWTVTGAAAGWNSFRHTPTPYRILIDPNEERIAFERQATYGGKRYVNRVGRLTPGGYAEVDFSKAYTVIARDEWLPMKPTRGFDSLPVDDWRIGSEGWGVIAEVEIETDSPDYPVRHGDRVWYPVGRFRTVLASPDIVHARDRGRLRAVYKGQTYKTAPIMRRWAQWTLDVIEGVDGEAPGVARLAARQWGRSVVGKWAQHGYERIKLGYSITEGWSYEDTWIGGVHARGSIVDIGGRRYLSWASGNGENAFPAVLAFVESHVRARLNTAIEAVGSKAFVQCDTDGMLVSSVDMIRRIRSRDTMRTAVREHTDPLAVILRKISERTEPLEMRVKSTYKRVEIIGPQHLVVDGVRRFSGVPVYAQPINAETLGALVWPKWQTQIAEGDPRGYVRQYQTYHVPSALASGWVDAGGTVYPLEATVGADGSVVMLPWERSRWSVPGVVLAPVQNKAIVAAVNGSG